MSRRWPGGIVSSTYTAPTGTTATGVWTTNTQAQSAKGGIWPGYPPTSVEYLVVAGGAGGANYGGGGAGGVLTGSVAVSSGASYTVTVGGGGTINGDGTNSVFSSITASKGLRAVSTFVGGVSGNGFAGGIGANLANPYLGGGGAGASAVGGNRSGNTSGSGGAGLSSSISGASVGYGGGGGAGCEGGSASRGAGATTFGGGNGSGPISNNGSAGTANTGGGGGGGDGGNTNSGYAGGSGIVIIRYSDAYTAATSTTGSPTITVTGGYRIYKWTGSGSITF